MKLSPDEMERRRLRLKDAVDFIGGTDALGQAMGHKNGGFVRQMLEGKRNVTEKTVAEVESVEGLEGWFGGRAWPFETVSQDDWDALSARERHIAEEAFRKEVESILTRKRNAAPGAHARKDKAA